MKKNEHNIVVGIGVYLKEDYPEILDISIDRDKMEPTWEQWKAQKDLLKQRLKKEGILAKDIVVKPDAISRYCKVWKIPINGESRAQYVQHLVSNL